MDNVRRILDGESVRSVVSDSLLEMAKLTEKYADKDVTGDFSKFIYFSQASAAHAPRIKFYGGTKETEITTQAPSYEFGVNGPKNVIIEDWMTTKTCPNAFDKKYLKKIEKFISRHLAVLLLTWFRHLDEADTIHFFEGSLSFEDLLECIVCSEDLTRVKDEKELYKVCKDYDLFKF